ncbi:hypothetical protein CK203_022649 [Vitis vinifera]|uniref:Uncharacterized protein n=1 Tax=Vitis vinifera TaxID=29760 RepID=A0A438JEF7_VITVI|nr:hypothetical protein CK203_022649 [Vitis vinifera]
MHIWRHLTCADQDPDSEATVKDKQPMSPIAQASIGEESQMKAQQNLIILQEMETPYSTWIYLFLLVIFVYSDHVNMFNSDSCGTMDCNVTLDSSPQKQLVHAASDTLRGSLDSTSRSHSTVLEQVSPSVHALDLLQTINEKVGETSSIHHLQLFSEDKTIDMVCMASTQLEETVYPGSRERTSLRLGGDTVQSKQTPTRSPHFLDAAAKSSTSQMSLLRHRLMLESIEARARALKGRGSCSDKFEQHTTLWPERGVGFSMDRCQETWKGQLGCHVKGPKIALLTMEGGKRPG